MKIKNIIFCFIFCFSSSIFAEDFQFAGDWAIDDGIISIDRGFFISITRLDEDNRYFVISYNNELSFFTFIGLGYTRDDGYLQIDDNNGNSWLLTPAWSYGRNESITISNLDNEETFAWFIRLNEKYHNNPSNKIDSNGK